jgi:hypothetical protein
MDAKVQATLNALSRLDAETERIREGLLDVAEAGPVADELSPKKKTTTPAWLMLHLARLTTSKDSVHVDLRRAETVLEYTVPTNLSADHSASAIQLINILSDNGSSSSSSKTRANVAEAICQLTLREFDVDAMDDMRFAVKGIYATDAPWGTIQTTASFRLIDMEHMNDIGLWRCTMPVAARIPALVSSQYAALLPTSSGIPMPLRYVLASMLCLADPYLHVTRSDDAKEQATLLPYHNPDDPTDKRVWFLAIHWPEIVYWESALMGGYLADSPFSTVSVAVAPLVAFHVDGTFSVDPLGHFMLIRQFARHRDLVAQGELTWNVTTTTTELKELVAAISGAKAQPRRVVDYVNKQDPNRILAELVVSSLKRCCTALPVAVSTLATRVDISAQRIAHPFLIDSVKPFPPPSKKLCRNRRT